jgi:hypothetical protein
LNTGKVELLVELLNLFKENECVSIRHLKGELIPIAEHLANIGILKKVSTRTDSTYFIDEKYCLNHIKTQ